MKRIQGKVAVVTGSSSGIGFETSIALAIRLGLNVDKIREVIFTSPTNSYDINYML